MSPVLPHFAFSLQEFLQDCNRDFFDANATVQKGLEKLGLRDLEDTLPGMELPLMPHQVLGVAFMLDRERSTFKGGILADEMGVSCW
jgi:SNF2 family DNA or RNA helicase